MTVNGDTICSLIQTFPVLLILAQNYKRCLETPLIYKPPTPTRSPEYYEALDALVQNLFGHGCKGHDHSYHDYYGHQYGKGYEGKWLHNRYPDSNYGNPCHHHDHSYHHDQHEHQGHHVYPVYGHPVYGHPIYGFKKVNVYNTSGNGHGYKNYAPNQVYKVQRKYKVVVKNKAKHRVRNRSQKLQGFYPQREDRRYDYQNGANNFPGVNRISQRLTGILHFGQNSNVNRFPFDRPKITNTAYDQYNNRDGPYNPNWNYQNQEYYYSQQGNYPTQYQNNYPQNGNQFIPNQDYSQVNTNQQNFPQFTNNGEEIYQIDKPQNSVIFPDTKPKPEENAPGQLDNSENGQVNFGDIIQGPGVGDANKRSPNADNAVNFDNAQKDQLNVEKNNEGNTFKPFVDTNTGTVGFTTDFPKYPSMNNNDTMPESNFGNTQYNKSEDKKREETSVAFPNPNPVEVTSTTIKNELIFGSVDNSPFNKPLSELPIATPELSTVRPTRPELKPSIPLAPSENPFKPIGFNGDEITTPKLPELTPVPKTNQRNNFNFGPAGIFSETCQTVTNDIGSCLSIQNCQPYLKLLRTGKNNPSVTQLLRRAHCGFEGSNPKVCCPRPGIPDTPDPTTTTTTTTSTTTTTTTTTESSSGGRTNDADYISDLPEPPECGVSSAAFSRVVGGVNASLGDFPWMALLGYKGRRTPAPRWLCGGSLISSKHVLTAAHCIHNHENDLYLVRLGELDLARDDDGATPTDVPIKTQIKHEEYNPKAYTNDIAILVLETVVQFTDLIRPICIPVTAELRSNTFVNYNPIIAGWGDTEFRGPKATHLQALQLPVVTNEYCARAYSAYKAQVIDSRVLCAGYEKGGKDACQGDSGGPLMQPIWNSVTFKTYFFQTGVVSFGRKCAEPEFPGVYTRVTEFVPWIRDNVVAK